jgi:hypothetical protein
LYQDLKKVNPDGPGLFMQLLADCGITSNMKWDQVAKII